MKVKWPRLTVKILLVVFLLLVLFPVFNVLLMSVKPSRIFFDVPPKFVFRPTAVHYREIVKGGQYVYFVNSGIVATGATLAALFIGSLAAFAFVRFRFVTKKFLFFLILVTRMYPPVTTVIPIYFMMHYFGLLDTKIALIITYTGFQLPLVVWVMKSFFATIPKEIQESAALDGCSLGGIFFKIIVPLAKPGLAATGILIFIFNWNEFLFALTLTSLSAKTMPVIIMSFMEMEKSLRWGPLAALGFLTISPILVFMIAFGKYLIKGLTLGAIKG